MKRRRADKLSHAAHIKRNTQGTSNELSFSVLDAAKNALDEGKHPSEQVKRFGRINLFTLPTHRRRPPSTPKKDEALAIAGSLASAILPSGTPDTVKPRPHDSSKKKAEPEREKNQTRTIEVPAQTPFERAPRSTGRTSKEEIAWRKTRRRHSRILAGVIGSFIIVAAIGAGVLYLYNDTMRYQENIRQIDTALSALGSTDEVLLALDKTLQDPMSDEAMVFHSERESDVEQAFSSLAEVERSALDAQAGLRETREQQAVDALLSAVSARRVMFEKGWSILDAAADASPVHDRLVEIWREVVDADELAREAAGLAAEGKQENIAQSTDLTRQAQDGFNSALEQLQETAQSAPSIDVTTQIAYIEKRIESLVYAAASNDALLARDTATAVENNDSYNSADAEAAQMAASLPSDPGQPAIDALSEAEADDVESYEAARGQASSSDAFLRDYLGRSSK